MKKILERLIELGGGLKKRAKGKQKSKRQLDKRAKNEKTNC